MTGTYKVSTNTTSLGTAAKFGAADINRITKTLNGDVDVDTPDINSPLTLHSSKIFINNPANTFAYTVIAAAIAANRNLTLPLLTGNDTIAVLAEAQTFLNKTIAAGSNTITGIVDANIDAHTTSKIAINSKALLNSAVVYNDQANTFGDFNQTFRSGKLKLSNPTNDFFYIMTGAAIVADKILNLPLLTTDDTLVTEAMIQPLTNKTLDSTNTISSATSLPTVTVAKGGTGQTTATLGFDALSPMTTAGDIIYGGASGTGTRLAKGTANQLLRINSGATAPEWASTLSGLTLTAPVISTISNTGTLTLPTSTDTLVGKATTDILTNKTIDSASNTFQNITVHPGIKKTGDWTGISQLQSSSGILQGMWTATATGTGALTGLQKSSAGSRIRWTTGATGGASAGNRTTSAGVTLFERDMNPMFSVKAQVNQTTNERVFMGFYGDTAAPVLGVDPLASKHGVGFFLDTSVDANWHIIQNAAAGSSNTTTIANVAAADTSAHVFSIRAVNASTKFQYAYESGVPNASTTWTDINTSIPGATNGLNLYFHIENIGSNTDTFDLYWVHVEIDA